MRFQVAAVLLSSLVATEAFVAPQSCGTAFVNTKLNMSSKVDDKTEVREYFNTEGFNRWNKIYSDSDEVNKVQMDIRDGHQQTIDKIIRWIETDGDIAGKSVCDCGCGVGSLAIPLAQMGAWNSYDYRRTTIEESLFFVLLKTDFFVLLGAKVSASDISSSMAEEASRRAKELGLSAKQANFYTSDLETVTGKYDTVTCVDVAIHYPTEQMKGMVQHLCSLSNDRVIFSFAPDTWYYALLKKVGELFPGPSKTTRAYLHPEAAVREALNDAGFEITRDEMTGTNFYFSRLFEARRK